ncbi:MAG: hypothetical protein V2I41_12095, partial [Pseudomonadales bacterium]|nr:hypothetical protein [Pseudomonadales bacterium]
MPQFVMVMMGSASSGDWDDYVDSLVNSGCFRGGSSLANGVSVSKNEKDGDCLVTGFMRFSAESIDEVRKLVSGN